MTTAPEPLAAAPACDPTPDAGASCCSAFYEQDWVRHLAEDIFHPGGEALTLRTVQSLQLGQGASILDLGCGVGSTALLLNRSCVLRVSAVDLSAANVAVARERAAAESADIRFLRADVHELPFPDGSFDAALAECTLSLFAKPAVALREIGRVLKPDGQLAVSDMAVGGRLPDDIQSVLAPWTCLADAVTEQQYRHRFESAGYAIEEFADESQALLDMIVLLKRKLLLLSAGSLLAGQNTDAIEPETILHWLNRFKSEVASGTIRYLRFRLSRAL